jgi:hypothetical protein
MRKSSKLLVATAAAALVATGGTAFTAAGSGVDDAYVSYDANQTSGVTVTNVAYNVNPNDASLLTNIVFTETEDVSSGYDAILTVNGPSGTQIDCTPTFDNGVDNLSGTSDDGVGTITCPTTATVASVAAISLTVTAN